MAAGAPPLSGPEWSAEALGDLRARGYRPRAWVCFLRDSRRRAAEDAARRPRAAAQIGMVGALGLAPWVAAVASGRRPLAVCACAWWYLVWMMLRWHLGMLEDADGRPLDSLGPANALTLARAAAAPLMFRRSPRGRVALLALAATSDVLDGRIARQRGQATRLGAWLDGGVDGVLLSGAAIGALRRGQLPPRAAVLVVARQAVPWPALAAQTFARAEVPRVIEAPSARLPGLVVWLGLALGRRGSCAVELGSLGGLLVHAHRAWRRQQRTRT